MIGWYAKLPLFFHGRTLPAGSMVVICLFLAGCFGGVGKEPDLVKSDGTSGSVRFEKAEPSLFGYDECDRSRYEEGPDRPKANPNEESYWPWKAVAWISPDDKIKAVVEGCEPSSVYFETSQSGIMTMPTESSPASEPASDRIVHGEEETKDTDHVNGYAVLRLNPKAIIGGFKAKVYKELNVEVQYITFILPPNRHALPSDPVPVPPDRRVMERGIREVFKQAVVTISLTGEMNLTGVEADYDLNDDGKLGLKTGGNFWDEYNKMRELIRDSPRLIVGPAVRLIYVESMDILGQPAGRDAIFAGGDGDNIARHAAHELGHIFGLGEYEDSSEGQTKHDPENLMWSDFGTHPESVKGHLRYWQWDTVRAAIKSSEWNSP